MTSPSAPSPVPRFRHHLKVETGSSAVFVFDEDGVTSIEGGGVSELAPLLDGSRTLAQVHAAVSGPHVDATIQALAAAGLVVFDDAPGAGRGDGQAAWWDQCGQAVDPCASTAVVAVLALGGAATERAEGALRACGVDAGAAEGPGPRPGSGLTVVLCRDYLDPGLDAVDAAHRRAGVPWLLCRPAGGYAWIGPVFGTGTTGCWHCLAHRLWTHRHAERVVQTELGRQGPAERAVVSATAAEQAVMHLVALEVTKWIGGYRYDGQNAVCRLDSRTLHSEHHPLRRRPQCPACGDPSLGARVAETEVRVASAHGPGYRTAGVHETLARYAGLISPITGIVKEITRDERCPSFAHAYRSGANPSRAAGLAALRRGARAENGGKGLTADEARLGALCEAVERYCGTWQGDEPTVSGSLSSLAPAAIDPRTCLLFADDQYEDRERWNERHSSFNRVPEPFDPDAVCDWSPLWSLRDRRRRLLPTAMLYFGAPAHRSVFADSNGCAAGSSREDALLQGLLELVERDAVALWWHNRSRVPGVDLVAVGGRALAQHQRWHGGLGRELWALDVTSDLGVPTVVALSRRVGDPEERVLLGFGAHLDLSGALTRAVTELNQMLPLDTAPADAPDDPDWARWAAGGTVGAAPYLVPLPDVPARGPDRHPAPVEGDIGAAVELLVDRLSAAGLDTLVLDQTRPDVEMPVVRVTVPGLRPFWTRYAPGRLFDAPVALGRRSEPATRAELNPFALFM